jgi:hypothetical protein
MEVAGQHLTQAVRLSAVLPAGVGGSWRLPALHLCAALQSDRRPALHRKEAQVGCSGGMAQ